MNVASLELCKELYELSGWDDVEDMHQHYTSKSQNIDEQMIGTKLLDDVMKRQEGKLNDMKVESFPAYDLGYLLRKLPRYVNEAINELIIGRWGSRWRACYMPINLGHYSELREEADTPEDAACRLAIELFKQGILKR